MLHPGISALLLLAFCLVPVAAEANTEFRTLSDRFGKEVRPLLDKYCIGCHSTEKQKGELDLERFTGFEDVLKVPKVWENAAEQLATGEMPPKKEPQPTLEERQQLRAWIESTLDAIATARAGDPGPVVLRRLSNAEYTYTIRDLTGVESLDPAKEFPGDSAAGEGFMNVGNALVMSPSWVTKYLDAAKAVAGHAMLLPDGIRFSAKNTRRDWTEEILEQIRAMYREYTDHGGGTSVNLQGIRFDTKDGGVLPLDRYLAALLEERAQGAVRSDRTNGLSAKYLQTLRETLNGSEPSLLLEPIRARWRSATPEDAVALAEEIGQWQHALWKFNTVGHIGKRNGPTAWMEPISPLQSRQDVRLKLDRAPGGATHVTLYLVASDAGDGNEGDFVIWQKPRFTAPGRPDLLLRDVREISRNLFARRDRILSNTTNYLAAVAMAEASRETIDLAGLASEHGLEADALSAWMNYLGVISADPVKVQGHFTDTFTNGAGYAFINGWGKSGTPHLTANSSDQHVRIPGNMKPHSVAVHPSPSLAAAVAWQSPVAANVCVTAKIQHAHPECGNGVTWSLELRRGGNRQRLAGGFARGEREVFSPPVEGVVVRPGDLISLLIGSRDGNHSCDLTMIDLTITGDGEANVGWNLASEISPDVLAGNPRPDRFGNADVWHFYTEPDKSAALSPAIPAGSLVAKWLRLSDSGQKATVASELQRLLVSRAVEPGDSPDAILRRQLTSLGGPLFGAMHRDAGRSGTDDSMARDSVRTEKAQEGAPGLDSSQFGKGPDGSAIDPDSLCVRAPSVIEIRLPADLIAGCEFVTTGSLDPETGREGSVQLLVSTKRPAMDAGMLPITAKVSDAVGPWYANNRVVSHTAPILVNDESAARRRIEAAFDEFRRLFPAALCYTKIVPVDEVVTLTLFYREDHNFSRLMLDKAQAARLDRLWDELHYVSQDALTLVDAFEQLWQYATQDADPSVFEPMRQPILQRAAAFRHSLVESEPKHLDAVIGFAGRAYRRPLTDPEQEELRRLYQRLRDEQMSHDEAIRLTIARVLVAPAFLYRTEKPGPGTKPGPVDDWELATRLSYFLWSSLPDAELRDLAAQGKLQDPNVLAAQSRRMMRDWRVRRLAIEFACAWLHIYAFDELGEKSDRHFPMFADLRGSMYDETIRFFTHLFQNDRPLLEMLDADYTFLNRSLAEHYGIQHVQFAGPDEWRRVDGISEFSRGGVLGHATVLAKQSGASRTSPILRGNWVSEVLLGEKLPRPPADVPQLPEDESSETLTVRQLTERHSSDPRCATCHSRIDPFGFALEQFDAVGRFRERDLGGRAIDTRARVPDGAEFAGIDGLRRYLLTTRREAFLRHFCRKLLGYSLGRAVMLSDRPLMEEMLRALEANGYKIGAAVEAVVRSKQFREIRGRGMAYED